MAELKRQLLETEQQKLREATDKLGADEVKSRLDKAGVTDQVKQANQRTQGIEPVNQITPQAPETPINTNLEDTIKSGQYTASQAVEYNRLKGDRQATSNLSSGKTTQTPKPNDVNIKPNEPTQEITPVADWKARGSDVGELENIIEDRYNVVATNENGVIKANIGGVDYQWIVDGQGNSIKTKVGGENPNDIYGQLVSGQQIADTGVKTTKAYSTAKARYDIAKKYQGMTEDQLYSAYINGEIGEQLEKDLVDNPYLAAAKEKYNQKLITDNINNESQTVLNAYNKANGNKYQTTEKEDFLQTLVNKLTQSLENSGTDQLSFKEHMATNYPDLVSDTRELNQKNEDLKRLVDERDARLENIIKEHPGISINRATMLAARENKDINAQIKSMSYELGTLQANINYQTTMADKEFGYEQARQARQDNLDREQRGYAFNTLNTLQNQQYQQEQLQDSRQYQQDVLQEQRAYDESQGITTTPKLERIGTDENGNPVYGTYNSTSGQYEPIQSISGAGVDSYGNVDYTTLDFTGNQDLINQYPNEASFKNNNPTGMTWGISNNLKGLFDEAGVKYSQGTYRPPNEGGSYIKFASVQDGLDAYSIALTQAGTQDIHNRLATWVGTKSTATNDKYAKDIMTASGITKGTKFNELSEDQLSLLMQEQLKRESPNFYNELAKIPTGTPELSLTDINTYNNTTFKPTSLKTKEDKAKYAQFLEEKKKIMDDKDASIEDILDYSAGGRGITGEIVKPLQKFDMALAQLGDIQDQIGNMNTGPILGRLKGINPYDVDAQTLKASLTALMPTLARGVYGEVGVLTDNDIRLYAKTIPNLTATKDVNNAILAMTLKVLANGYKKQLRTLASANYDVSGFTGMYDNLMSEVNQLESQLPSPGKQAGSGSIKDLTNKYFGGKTEQNSNSGAGSTLSDDDLYNNYYN